MWLNMRHRTITTPFLVSIKCVYIVYGMIVRDPNTKVILNKL